LLPALYRRRASGYLSANSRVIGVARSELSRDEYLAQVQASCQTYLGKDYDEKRWAEFAQHVDYVKVDASSPEDFASLKKKVEGCDQHGRAFFLSVAPDLFAPICEGLATHSLALPTSRVVLEKPLGHDRESSAQINERVGRIFSEQQIFRIDHYLGK